ncbi:MAG: hypothetical protein WDA27_06725 [Actinomycetota bacterium]
MKRRASEFGPIVAASTAVVGAGLVVAEIVNAGSLATMSCVLLVAACVLVALPHLRSGRRDFFHPVVLVSVQIAVYYGIRGLALLASTRRNALEINHLVRQFQGEFLVPSIAVAGVALAAFVIGFSLPVSRGLRWLMPTIEGMPPAEDAVWRRRGFAMLGLGVVGSSASAYRLVTGRGLILGLDTVIDNLQIFGWAGMALILMHVARASRPRSFGVVFYACLVAVGFAVIGFRAQGVWVAVAFMTAFHYGVRPLRVRATVVVLIFTLFVAFPFVAALRIEDQTASQSGRIENMLSVPDRLATGSQVFAASERAPGFGGYLGETARNVIYRLYGTDTLITIVAQTPDPRPYIWRERVLTLAQTFVPRVFWTNKPMPNISDYFKQAYWGARPDNQSNQKPGLIGDWYIQGGVIAVMLGMLCFGVTCRAGRQWFDSHRDNPLALAFYVVMVNTIATMESDTILLATRVVIALALFRVAGSWIPRVAAGLPSRRHEVRRETL